MRNYVRRPTTKACRLVPQLLLGTIFLCSLATPGALAQDSKNAYRIVTTTGMITDIVKRVAGDRAVVEGLISSGVDPHLYKPTRGDIAKLMTADVIFYNGLLLEGKMTDALIRAATSGKKVFAVTELIDEAKLLEPEEFQGHYDPHVWMDPVLWAEAVRIVRDALSAFDPVARTVYEANTEALLERIQALHVYAEHIAAQIPKHSRILVTAHDAFNYFGRRYDFQVLGIQGLSTESEAGVKDIEEIVATLVEKNILAVFIESTVSDRNVKALIEGAAARGHSVRIGGELFSDAMGPAGTYEGTYIGMIDHNVSTIGAALGAKVPQGGFRASVDAVNPAANRKEPQ